MDIDLDTRAVHLPLIRIYEKSFYNNYLVTQIDFSFLNNTYQVYSGGAPYFNPGVNLLTRFGTVDLFENYQDHRRIQACRKFRQQRIPSQR